MKSGLALLCFCGLLMTGCGSKGSRDPGEDVGTNAGGADAKEGKPPAPNVTPKPPSHPDAASKEPAPASARAEPFRERTKHLQLTIAPDRAVKAGGSVPLHFDIELLGKFHIYAPGATGYIITQISFADSPHFKPGKADWPAGKKRKVAGEIAPVYEGKVRVTQTLDVGADLPDGTRTLRVTGTVRYQACDEKLCHPPKQIPFALDLAVAP